VDIQILNPLEDPDWDALLLRSGDQTFFHTAAWAKALNTAYRFKPLYFAAREDGRLVFLMPMMEVRSPLTGTRGVSLPFADQCPPFFRDEAVLRAGIQRALDYGRTHRWKRIDWRDFGFLDALAAPREEFFVHEIDLARTEAELSAGLSDGNRRNIKKAGREGVDVRIETTWDSLKAFCRLNDITRKRHGLPPQPFAFFKGVFESIIAPGYGNIATASFHGEIVAASVFFRFGAGALYKYGASDMAHQNLRANNLVMWEALKWHRQQGFKTLNLGRSEMKNAGLLQFKRTWGAVESRVRYYRYDFGKGAYVSKPPGGGGLSTKLFARAPLGVLRLLGRLLYKHVG
jgi:hypothetical protein